MLLKRLKELREQKGYTQDGLGLQVNVSQSTISAYEAGTRSPDLDILNRFADFFGVSIDYLADRTDMKNYPDSKFTAQEINLIINYRKLTKGKREKLSAYMEGLIDND